MTTRPDYDGGGLLNLMATLERGLGGDSPYAPLGALSVERVAAARHVVLWLIDGLGDAVLQEHATRLSSHRLCGLSSVFPSATAAAVTSVLTGAPPARHAVVGWFMHLSELDRVMTFLPFRPRAGAPVEATPGPLVGAGPLFDRIATDAVVVSPERIVDSAVSRALCGRADRRSFVDLAGCVRQIEAAVRDAPARRYVYAYWSELDALSHEHGCRSRPVLEHLRALESAVEQLAESLAGTGTLLLVTADHGFVDVTGATRLDAHPELAACLAHPLCGEPRATFCHLRPEAADRFERYVRDELSDRFELFESARLIEDGWLGPPPHDERLRSRLGDFVLAGKRGEVIYDRLPGEGPWELLGVHGGTSAEEMAIPLLCIDC